MPVLLKLYNMLNVKNALLHSVYYAVEYTTYNLVIPKYVQLYNMLTSYLFLTFKPSLQFNRLRYWTDLFSVFDAC